MVQLGAQAFGAGAVFVAVVLSSVLAHFGEQRFGFVDLVVFDNYVKVCLVRLPGPVGLGEGALGGFPLFLLAAAWDAFSCVRMESLMSDTVRWFMAPAVNRDTRIRQAMKKGFIYVTPF